LPDARRVVVVVVVVVSVHGERELRRIDDAGLFAGPFDDPHYRLRRSLAPVGFVLGDFIPLEIAAGGGDNESDAR
jgi:hypothetical protein